MNPLVTTLLTIFLSALVGSATAIVADRMKLKDRLRIEHEYKILKQLWEAASNIQALASVVANRSLVRGVPDTKDSFREFTRAAVHFHNEIEHNKPFYPIAIYRHVSVLYGHVIPREATQTVLRQCRQNPEDAVLDELLKVVSDSFREKQVEIGRSVDQLCNKIRRHIHHDYANVG